MTRSWHDAPGVACAVGLACAAAGCKDDPPPKVAATASADKPNDSTEAMSAGAASSGVAPSGRQCIVHLHGKSGRGAPTREEDGISHVFPNGNAEGWGGLQWVYYPEDGYQAVRGIVAGAAQEAGCGRVIVHGFSNGASAVAKLFCRGEHLSNAVIGYIIDDPVTDHAVEGCAPPVGVKVRLYWSGGLAHAVDGWDCGAADWTCEGGSTIGIEKYSAALGTKAEASIHKTHEAYASPPEHDAWW